MNLTRTSLAALRLAFRLGYGLRRLLPKQASTTFGQLDSSGQTINKIYVINLDRASDRWSRVKGELKRIRDRFGNDLLGLTERHAAVDARSFLHDLPKDKDVDPFYTLADQLFVEPQPLTLPTRFELETPIRMSRAEIAVAKSHIEIWRRIALGTQAHVLILEDDVWFHPSFGPYIDEAWRELKNTAGNNEIPVEDAVEHLLKVVGIVRIDFHGLTIGVARGAVGCRKRLTYALVDLRIARERVAHQRCERFPMRNPGLKVRVL